MDHKQELLRSLGVVEGLRFRALFFRSAMELSHPWPEQGPLRKHPGSGLGGTVSASRRGWN